MRQSMTRDQPLCFFRCISDISEAFLCTLMHCALNSVTAQFHTAPARAPPLFVCLLLALVLLLFVCLFTLASVN